MAYMSVLQCTSRLNIMEFLLETNPAFLILPVESNEYVFYNSLQHVGVRLSHLEMLILDLYYKYTNKAFIIRQFPENQTKIIEDALLSIDRMKLLVCENLENDCNIKAMIPSVYYLHLTYQCNLNCTYCYNKNIRKKEKRTLSLTDWKVIIDKISPYAKGITLTGGEFLLYPQVLEIVRYIKTEYPDIEISAISNCMHNFENSEISEVFNYLSSVSFSCDSISKEGERKGFDPTLFKSNISWIKEKFPHVDVSLASAYTSSNADDLNETWQFCKQINCNFDKTLLIPECAEDVDMMPDIHEQIRTSLVFGDNKEIKRLHRARIRCGAGKSVCSIDPVGNVYPCQSLHFEELLLGNILNEELGDMKSIGTDDFCLKTVNELPVCGKCKVKYICGGGCIATAYQFYGRKFNRNHLTCHMNYINSIEKLKSLNNRI